MYHRFLQGKALIPGRRPIAMLASAWPSQTNANWPKAHSEPHWQAGITVELFHYLF